MRSSPTTVSNDHETYLEKPLRWETRVAHELETYCFLISSQLYAQ